jgi:hypothetical protein
MDLGAGVGGKERRGIAAARPYAHLDEARGLLFSQRRR